MKEEQILLSLRTIRNQMSEIIQDNIPEHEEKWFGRLLGSAHYLNLSIDTLEKRIKEIEKNGGKK